MVVLRWEGRRRGVDLGAFGRVFRRSEKVARRLVDEGGGLVRVRLSVEIEAEADIGGHRAAAGRFAVG